MISFYDFILYFTLWVLPGIQHLVCTILYIVLHSASWRLISHYLVSILIRYQSLVIYTSP